MIKKIFITSTFGADGVLMQWATSEGIEVVGESLIDFNAVPFEMPEGFDVVIFYSKNAVRYFYEGLSSDQVDQVKNAVLVCIGPATAEVAEEVFETEVNFQYQNLRDKPEVLIDALRGKRCLIPQASQSRQTIEKLLNDCTLIPVVVYDNAPRSNFMVPEGVDLAVVTSPMNAKVFLSALLDVDIPILAIGQTSADFAKQNFGIDPKVAPEPTESGILAALKEIAAKKV